MKSDIINELNNSIGLKYSRKNNCGKFILSQLRDFGFLSDIDDNVINSFNLNSLGKNDDLLKLCDSILEKSPILSDMNIVLSIVNSPFPNHISLYIKGEFYEMTYKGFKKTEYKDFFKINRVVRIYEVK